MTPEETAGLKSVILQREALYRLLARIYKHEPDQAFVDGLREAEFPQDDGSELSAGFAELSAWLKDPAVTDPVTDLAVDFAHSFLGAGIAEGLVAYPFESVYTSPQHLVMQDAWEDVCRIYREHGLGRAKEMDMHEDQIGLECEFMAILAGRSLEAIEKGDDAALEKTLADQFDFAQKHLNNWVYAWCNDVVKTALTGFYRGAARATGAFIQSDVALLSDLLGKSAD